MKIVVSKTSLEKAVKNIAQVINKKCALPILGDIHFKCQQGNSGNYMEVMGSDSEVWLRYDLSLEELSEDGEFCVDATMLKNALANLPEQPLELIVQPVGDVANIAINHQTGHTIIPVESSDEYPKPIQIDEDNLPCLSATCSVLKRAMKRSVYALGDDEFEDEAAVLGDIVISLERAVYQAKEYGHSYERELAFLTVHSMLHLLGYDHEEGKAEESEMFEKQEEILKKMHLARKAK